MLIFDKYKFARHNQNKLFSLYMRKSFYTLESSLFTHDSLASSASQHNYYFFLTIISIFRLIGKASAANNLLRKLIISEIWSTDFQISQENDGKEFYRIHHLQSNEIVVFFRVSFLFASYSLAYFLISNLKRTSSHRRAKVNCSIKALCIISMKKIPIAHHWTTTLWFFCIYLIVQ